MQKIQPKRDNLKIPSNVRDIVPIKRIWPDGIFQTGNNQFSICMRFTDINYAAASAEDKKNIFTMYSDILNSFDSGAVTKITIHNRRLNKKDFEKRILIPLKNDGLDVYREEYNEMLLEKAADTNHMVQEKYITVSVTKKNIEEARSYFSRTRTEFTAIFSRLNSKCEVLKAKERLNIFHDFYRAGEEDAFFFDLKDTMKKGHDIRDYICPDSVEHHDGYLKIGNRYARVFYLEEYASYIKDEFVADLTEINQNMMISIDAVPIPTDAAVRMAQQILLGIETNIANWQRRQNRNGNYVLDAPYELTKQKDDIQEFLDDLRTRDQKMILSILTIVLTADTEEQLESDTEQLLSVGRSNMCKLSTLQFQQLEGMNTALPYGVQQIDPYRTLTTESLAVFMPFKVQDIMDSKGIYMGVNAISRNLLLCDKSKLLNPNAFLLGVPGAGKSFFAKLLMLIIILLTEDDVLVCDPENEYGALAEALKGEVIRISAGSPDHINAMDMTENYGDGKDPIVDKSEFIMSIFEQLDKKGINAKERSIIDRCTADVYEECRANGEMPTLKVLRRKLLQQPEQQAKELALKLELFTDGSLDAFSHPTNVDTQNRLIIYDISELGKQLKTMGLLVITDAMLNRVTENWKKGKRTHIFIDEFHVVFENEYSGIFFNSAWRRFRKRNAFPTAITQNVEYLLDSVLASTMLSNSEFVVMLNQASKDQEKLSDLLDISDEQLDYINNVAAGHGLIKYGSSLIPFINEFPKDTRLYRLMTTKPGEWEKQVKVKKEKENE